MAVSIPPAEFAVRSLDRDHGLEVVVVRVTGREEVAVTILALQMRFPKTECVEMNHRRHLLFGNGRRQGEGVRRAEER